VAGGGYGEGVWEGNMVERYIMYLGYENGKMKCVETIPGVGGIGVKGV
jgi:hypothetical protein